MVPFNVEIAARNWFSVDRERNRDFPIYTWSRRGGPKGAECYRNDDYFVLPDRRAWAGRST